MTEKDFSIDHLVTHEAGHTLAHLLKGQESIKWRLGSLMDGEPCDDNQDYVDSEGPDLPESNLDIALWLSGYAADKSPQGDKATEYCNQLTECPDVIDVREFLRNRFVERANRAPSPHEVKLMVRTFYERLSQLFAEEPFSTAIKTLESHMRQNPEFSGDSDNTRLKELLSKLGLSSDVLQKMKSQIESAMNVEVLIDELIQ